MSRSTAPLLTVVAALLAWPSEGAAQLTTLVDSGPPEAVVDLLYVAEGYTAQDKAAFLADAKAIHAGLFQTGPYAVVQPWLGARALFVPSAQAGSDHPSAGVERDTAFDSTYDSNGIARLITANNGKVLGAANAAWPDFDVAVLVVNDKAYGGSGGSVPMVSLHPASVAILRHELAHNLADLADEYEAPYPGYPPGDSEPNVVAEANLGAIPWAAWLSPGVAIPTPIADAIGPHTPIGAYEGARYKSKGVFRPAPKCLMRTLDQAFCPVCAEALILAVAEDSKQLRGGSPEEASVSCTLPDCPQFAITTVGGVETRWLWQGQPVGQGESWSPSAAGAGTLEAEVRLKTDKVRSDPKGLLVERRSWQLAVTAAPAGDAGPSNDAAAGGADAAPGADAGPSADTQPADSQAPPDTAPPDTGPGGAKPGDATRGPRGCGAGPGGAGGGGALMTVMALLAAIRRRYT